MAGKDETMTELLFGRRVRKDHPRVRLCGLVDELSSQLGMCRLTAETDDQKEKILGIQKQLGRLASELSVLEDDFERFREVYEHPCLQEEDVEWLHVDANTDVDAFRFPGETVLEVHLNIARCVCRRLEVAVVEEIGKGMIVRGLVIRYLNRLSKMLFWLAYTHD